ncbi:hypothetical protein HDV06_005721 [Boothiomyces sp. JEL0866]|nr:hypothetical protein HDV06_005721 [Boothiomyces sp. JEL0866]
MDKKHEILRRHAKINSKEVAKIAARLWKNETLKVKEFYLQKSRDAFTKHKLEHPNFIWITGKRSRKMQGNPELSLNISSPTSQVSIPTINRPSHLERFENAYNHFDDLEKRTEIIKNFSISTSNEISKIAACMWKNEVESVKEYYREMSRRAFQEHKMNHPDYVWNVGRRAKRAMEQEALSDSLSELTENSTSIQQLYYSNLNEFFNDFVAEFMIPSKGAFVNPHDPHSYPYFDPILQILQQGGN